MSVESQLLMNFLSSMKPSTNQSSVQVSTHKGNSCVLCFNKTHKMHECPLLPENQRKRLVQAQNLNVQCTARHTTSTGRVLERISGIIDRHTNWSAGTAETTGKTKKTDKRSQKSGSFADWNAPDGRSRSFRYCQTKIVVITWKVRTIEARNQLSWVAWAITSAVCRVV